MSQFITCSVFFFFNFCFTVYWFRMPFRFVCFFVSFIFMIISRTFFVLKAEIVYLFSAANLHTKLTSSVSSSIYAIRDLKIVCCVYLIGAINLLDRGLILGFCQHGEIISFRTLGGIRLGYRKFRLLLLQVWTRRRVCRSLHSSKPESCFLQVISETIP